MAAAPVLMPKLGMTMEEGTVVAWEVDLGKRVEKGELLFILETEKAETEIEATSPGFLRHLYVPAGDTVDCGAVLAALTETADEAFDAEAFLLEHRPPEKPKAAAPTPKPAAAAAAPRESRRGGPVAPAARKLAATLGLDPAEIPGSGPGGRVTKRDVEAWAERRKNLVEVADGVSLDVPREGAGDRVLLLPGFGTDVSAFALQIPALAGDFEVVGVNPRGVALSDAPELDAYDVSQAAADAAALVDAPAHVVGASLGSAVAIELALAQPEKVRSLTLITPFTRSTPRLLAITSAWIAVAEAGPEILGRMLLPWLFGESLLADGRIRERTLRGLVQTLARVPPATLARTAAGLAGWSETRTGDLGEITVPTLVVVGGEDLLTPDGEEVAGAIPGAKLVRIENAGHALASEASEEVNAALRDHLAS